MKESIVDISARARAIYLRAVSLLLLMTIISYGFDFYFVELGDSNAIELTGEVEGEKEKEKEIEEEGEQDEFTLNKYGRSKNELLKYSKFRQLGFATDVHFLEIPTPPPELS